MQKTSRVLVKVERCGVFFVSRIETAWCVAGIGMTYRCLVWTLAATRLKLEAGTRMSAKSHDSDVFVASDLNL